MVTLIDDVLQPASELMVADVVEDGTSLSVSWSPPADVDVSEHPVEVQRLSDGTLLQSEVASGGSQMLTSLLVGVDYVVSVRTRDTAGQLSAAISTTAPPVAEGDGTPPVIPALWIRSPAAGDGTSLLASWPAFEGSNVVLIEFWCNVTDATPSALPRWWGPNTSAQSHEFGTIDSGVVAIAPGMEVSCRLWAREAAGNGASGEVQTVTLVGTTGDVAPPLVVAGLMLADVPDGHGGRLIATWTANSELDVDHCEVHLSAGSSFVSQPGTPVVLVDQAPPGQSIIVELTTGSGGDTLDQALGHWVAVVAVDGQSNRSMISFSQAGSARPVDNLNDAEPPPTLSVTLSDMTDDAGDRLRVVCKRSATSEFTREVHCPNGYGPPSPPLRRRSSASLRSSSMRHPSAGMHSRPSPFCRVWSTTQRSCPWTHVAMLSAQPM